MAARQMFSSLQGRFVGAVAQPSGRSFCSVATRSRSAERIVPWQKASCWDTFTPLANSVPGCVNLGQGFPNFDAPKFVVEATQRALSERMMVQYTRSQGHLRLVKALSQHFSPLFEREINPLTEVLTTVGATEALFLAAMSFINPGDEVILIEPFYDSYPAQVEMAHGKPVYVPLRLTTQTPSSSGDWTLDFAELERAITPRSRAIWINTPQNIPGKVYTRKELEQVAALAQKYDLLVVADQVYDSLVWDDTELTRIATLPGMWNRTISIGSAGKTFSTTGYKIGWVLAPPHLILPMQSVHQYVPFSVSTPTQEGTAIAFEESRTNGHWADAKTMFEGKRTRMVQMLRDAGLPPVSPQGSYFCLADFSRVDKAAWYDATSPLAADWQFCTWLAKEIKVAAIPPSAFYSKPPDHTKGPQFARFCFCKTDETLDQAAKNLLAIRKFLK